MFFRTCYKVEISLKCNNFISKGEGTVNILCVNTASCLSCTSRAAFHQLTSFRCEWTSRTVKDAFGRRVLHYAISLFCSGFFTNEKTWTWRRYFN